jgi:hypothetical protein
MLYLLRGFLFYTFLSAPTMALGFASPAESRLLRLIPHGAEIVAGVEDPRNPETHGHLLLVPLNNTFDFDDLQSLTGVDPRRAVDEVIWVAASSPQGELKEHLILVAGRFDREHIFKAAELNGAAVSGYNGIGVLTIEPFARERNQMRETRWMAIVDGRTAIFGTPWMVRKTLDLYTAKDLPDPILVDRLAPMRPDVNSWNVLTMPSHVFARHIAAGSLHAQWARVLEGADELTVGIHYGATCRVDFAIRMAMDGRASPIADVSAPRDWLQSSLFQGLRPGFENLSEEQNSYRGSIPLPRRQFDALEALSRDAAHSQ